MRLARLSRFVNLKKKYLICKILLAWIVFCTICSVLTVERQEIDESSFLGIFSKIRQGEDDWVLTNEEGVKSSRIKSSKLRVEHRILLIHKFTEKHGRSKLCSILTRLLEGFRISYTISRVDETPVTNLKHFLDENVNTGRYCVIVFLDLKSYVSLKPSVAKVIKSYTLRFKAGLLIFTNSYYGKVPELRVHVAKPGKDKHYYLRLNSSSPLLWMTRNGGNIIVKLNGRPSQGTKWSVIEPYFNSSNQYEVVQNIIQLNNFDKKMRVTPVEGKTLTTIAIDRGRTDGTRKVLFGGGFPFFVHSMLFIDSLHFLSPVDISFSLVRYIQIDIDDIFIGKKGLRLKKSDVLSLIKTQEFIASKIPGFKFNLGFSAKGFKQGTPEESEGDLTLIKEAHRFNWFGHMFDHEQAHKLNSFQKIRELMAKNLQFAKAHNLPTNTSYAVASHHSGVYPVHEPLFEAWKQVLGVHVTSTEEYPHLRPPWRRRGFIHKGMRVLPRQTCDLYTTTNFFNSLPGGKKYLDKTIEGGELFETVLRNPVSIFMTHMTNYANERLAQYVFTRAVRFLRRWTQLNLRFAPPTHLADYHFKLFPEDKLPIWQNPCDDHRHLEIWSSLKSCSRLPSFLIIGPAHGGLQKLQQLLEMHPSLLPTRNKNQSIEEIQFFDTENYLKGLDWYMQFFPPPSDITEMSYEISSSYFQSDKAPARASTLLKSAKFLIVLQDPSKRAHSHFMAWRHQGVIPKEVSLEDVLDGRLHHSALRKHLLEPGHYSEHISHWMNYVSHKQILVINEDDIISQPVVIMDRVQEFLNIENPVDYSRYLRFEESSQVYCPLNARSKNDCLGYKEKCFSPLTVTEKTFLKDYYFPHNKNLLQMNQKIQFAPPQWLQSYNTFTT